MVASARVRSVGLTCSLSFLIVWSAKKGGEIYKYISSVAHNIGKSPEYGRSDNDGTHGRDDNDGTQGPQAQVVHESRNG